MRSALPIGLAAALVLAALLLLTGCLSARPRTQDTATHQLVATTSAAEAALSLEELEVALRQSDPVSPRLLDLYVERALPEDPDASLLWEAYRRMLVGAGRYAGDTARVHLERHLVLAELLYTDVPPREAGLEARAARALRWWTESEAAPASGENERLVAHLERVAKARQRYPSPTSLSGLDDRGETLVRYGEPSRSRRVNFNEADLLRSFMRDGIPVRATDFPANEFWIYDQFGYAGNFLFVRRGHGEGFSHGTVNDLLPRQFRTRGVTGSVRSASFANAALRTLRYIFSQLALFHPAYSSRYDSIAEYVGWQEERAVASRLGTPQQSAVAGYDGAARTLESALSRNQRDDDFIELRRAQALPEEYAQVDLPGLPLSMRAVRWLEQDGGTTLRVYWRLAPDSYTPCLQQARAAPAQIRSRLLRYGGGFLGSTLVLDTLQAVAPWERVRRYDLALGDAAEAIALQVEGVLESRDGAYIGACTGVARLGAIEPLDLRAQGVAVSDLLPFHIVGDVVQMREWLAASGFSVDELHPFLQNALGPQDALGIYFEVYAQTDLSDVYMLEYSVAKRSPGGLLRRGQSQTAIYQARQAVVNHRLPAAFLVDRAEWADAAEVDIVVTVTNLDTGAVVERSLTFSVATSASASR